MNGPEKKVVYLSLCLFIFGLVLRFLPWGLPSIEKFQVGDSVVVDYSAEAQVQSNSVDKNKEIVDKISRSERKIKTKNVRKSLSMVALPIHINTANADMLCALNGVGPKLAEKIIAQREASGPFKNAKDLQKVPGIGKKKLEGILPGVIFD